MIKAWLVGTAALLTVGTANADWVTSYRAYQEAVAAGDQAAATKHAGEAWRQASEVLEPSENRALLAHNYINLVMFSDPGAAVPALRDAVAMGEKGFGLGERPLTSSQYLLAVSQPFAGRLQRAMTDQIEAAALNLQPQEYLDGVMIRATLLAGVELISEDEEHAAYVISDAMANALDQFQNVPANIMLETNSVRLSALFQDPPRSKRPRCL